MRRRADRWVLAAALGLASWGLASCSGREPIDAVVLVTMESISASQASAGHCNLSTTDTTPPEGGTSFAPPLPEDLDDLATLGVRYANAFAPSGSAFASLVSLHTGRAPEESGVYSDLDRLDDGPTLAESLALAGVRCGAIVARESLVKGCGLERGFELYSVKPRTAPIATDARVWLDMVRLARRDQPVFLWVHLSGARPPFEPREEFAARLAPGVDRGLGTLDSLAAMARNPAAVTEAQRRGVYELHAASILQDAANAKQLLVTLRPALRDFRNTLVLFVGTNGELAGELGSFGSRRVLRDSTLQVPLYLWRHGVQKFPRVAAPVVELADVAATIAAALRASAPEGSRGRDLLALISDADAADRVAYATWEERIFTVRTLRERLVCNPNQMETLGWPPGKLPVAREELFDEALDPRELVNAAAASPQRLAELRLRLERARAEVVAQPPRLERDKVRLDLLEAEGIHRGDGHPAGAPVTSSCGGGKR